MAIEENEVGVDDLRSLIKELKKDQIERIKRYVGDFADSFNMTEEDVLRLAFPEIIAQITEDSSGVPAKYANPENPEQTWSGRGKTPLWMEPFLEQGYQKEDFLIDKRKKSKK